MTHHSQSELTFTNIAGYQGSVSGLLDKPPHAEALLILAHGAGAGMHHAFMAALAAQLCSASIAVLRFQFPYMEEGSKRPDHPKLATATVAAVVDWALENEPSLPLFAGGKSFGARMTTTAAAEGLVPALQGTICFGFPLHPAKQLSKKRADHLSKLELPVLFLQGTRDALAELGLMTEVVGGLKHAVMHIVEGADHGFSVLKRSGRTDRQVLEELAGATQSFIRLHRGG